MMDKEPGGLFRIKRKLMHLRYKPIRVFCLHHVTNVYDDSMRQNDWLPLDVFKTRILSMQQQGVCFISLVEACHHLQNDLFRFKQYAVLTFDDGYKSFHEVLPWLKEHQLPVCLFINGKYLDGVSYRKDPRECYLTEKELFQLSDTLFEIGSHGWEHKDICNLSESEFMISEQRNLQLLSTHPRFIPFHAFTYGHYRGDSLDILSKLGMTPVFVDGVKNYHNPNGVHRELMQVR